jgi:hypothetical protein
MLKSANQRTFVRVKRGHKIGGVFETTRQKVPNILCKSPMNKGWVPISRKTFQKIQFLVSPLHTKTDCPLLIPLSWTEA